MELLLYWRIIRKRLWLIVLLAVAAVAGVAFYDQQQVAVYSTSTTLFLNPASPSPLLPYQTTAIAGSLADTYTAFMRTRQYAGMVVEQLDFEASEGEVLGALSSELVPDTQFFKIRAVHQDPAKAQALANTAAEVLIAQNIARQQAQQQQIEAQSDPAKRLERERLTELQQSLQNELTYYGDRIAGLQSQIDEMEARPPSAEIDEHILALREELVNYQTLRVQIFGSLTQTQATLAQSEASATATADTAVVVDPAPFPSTPQARQSLRNILVALAAALGLGVGLAYLLEYLDWTIKTPEELDAIYGMSTLGVVGLIKNGSRGSNGSGLVTVAAPRSPISEAFRALRTNIQFASPDRPLRSLLVTSAGPSEGKTLVSANLAVALAQAGKQVILVDTDLRRPRIHKVFDLGNRTGLTELVLDRKGVPERYLQPVPVENLRVMTSGPLPRDPSELLGSARMGEVMAALEACADVVIYDSPPAATVTDAVVVGRRVDGVLHVVRAGGPRRDVVRRTKTVLEKVGAHVLGPVLNQVNLSDVGYYNYYYYSGYYHEGAPRKSRSPLRRLTHRLRHGASHNGRHEPRPEPEKESEVRS